MESLTLQKALRAAERGIQAEALNQAFRRSRGKPRRTYVRTLSPMPLSAAAREELDQYVRAFFAGELRRISDRRQADAVPDPASPEPTTPATPPPAIPSQWDSDIELTPVQGADLGQHPQDHPEMDQGDYIEAPTPQKRVDAPAKGQEHRMTRPRKPT